MTDNVDLIRRLRAGTVAAYVARREEIRPAPCDAIVRRGQELREPRTDGYCREIHPEGHQCRRTISQHEDGIHTRHECRGCRFRWDL